MSEPQTIQEVFDHIDNVIIRLQDRIDEYNNAIDQLNELSGELRQFIDLPGRKKAVMDGDEPDIPYYLAEVGDIWTSVLEDPYDPEY